MSYCKSEANGKDRVVFLTKDDLSSPSTYKSKTDEEYDPWEPQGLILPNGSINWNCPCLGDMATGPCGLLFREAFTCFRNSDPKNKGAECFGAFSNLTECFAKYPKLYGSKDKESGSKTDSTANKIAQAMNDQN